MSTIGNRLKAPVFYVIYALLVIALAQITLIPKTIAAYEAGRLIDNSVFLDAKSMSINDIQNFLVSKNSGLKNMSFKLNCYGAGSQERQWYTAAGAQCDVLLPASQIIYYAAQIYGVNPKVILATMQKEQSLTTAPNPTAWQLNQAMGYACPTSGACGGNSTFPFQIDAGTWALRYHYERARGNLNWWKPSTSWTCGTEKSLYKPSLYPGQNVRFYDTNGTHYATIYIQNAATSAMYCYTPHAYNNPQGLYGRAPYGTTGLYYSGSYNFVYFYELWFGSTHSNVEATDDRFNLRDIPQVEGSTVKMLVNRGDINGVVCYQRGGDYIIDNKAGNTWLKITSPVSGWVATDSQMYDWALSKNTKPCPMAATVVYRAYNPHREHHFWTDDPEERSFVLNSLGFREGDPSFIIVDDTKAQGRPVWRLYNPKREVHFWTTDPGERNFAKTHLGFIDEGYAFSVSYGGQNTKPVWRLYDSRREKHFWTADMNERNFVVNSLGYKLEGEAFRIPN